MRRRFEIKEDNSKSENSNLTLDLILEVLLDIRDLALEHSPGYEEEEG